MATGDAALAEGMDLVDGASTLLSDVDEEINKTRDYIAEYQKRITVASTAPTSPTVGDLWFQPI